MFAKTDEQEKLFSEAICNIRKEFTAEDRNNLTMLKTTISKTNGKKLRAIRVVAPHKLEHSVQALKLNGLSLRGKHLQPWGPRQRVPGAFPREVNLYFRNLAHCISDTEVIESIGLSDDIMQSSMKKEERTTVDENCERGWFFTGNAVCKFILENE